jgi:hypothetical protein
MTVEVSTIYLRETATGAGIEAQLRDAIEEAQLVDWQIHWQPALIAILQELHRRQVPPTEWPQSWHWDWHSKMTQVEGLLAFKSFSVVCNGITQGLMRLDLTKTARLPDQVGKPLVYIDYLEVAPWNRPELGHTPRYQGVGTALLIAAIALSLQEGFKGRIGLHSLPQADPFYRQQGLIALGPDRECQGLTYFEMTPQQAEMFFEEED